MQQYKPHPLTVALKAVCPVLGANFVISSARDSERPCKYPLIEYVVIGEGESTFDAGVNCWRTELVVQLEYYLEEGETVCSDFSDLAEDQAAQAVQFYATSRLRSLVQMIVCPSSVSGSGIQISETDTIYGRYDFRLVKFLSGHYHRDHSSDRLTGGVIRFVISMLDPDNMICCTLENAEKMQTILKPDSVPFRLLEQRDNNS